LAAGPLCLRPALLVSGLPASLGSVDTPAISGPSCPGRQVGTRGCCNRGPVPAFGRRRYGWSTAMVRVCARCSLLRLSRWSLSALVVGALQLGAAMSGEVLSPIRSSFDGFLSWRWSGCRLWIAPPEVPAGSDARR
jgi:hypothetical protein